MNDLTKDIEALLFLAGEPQNTNKLAKVLGVKEKEIKEALKELDEKLKNRGLVLIRENGKIMLGTSSDSAKFCKELAKNELDKKLGQAGLETLAIILYKEDVSKSEIDYIRGVNAGFTLRNLLIKGLIERKPNPKDKRTYVYTPSLLLFQYLGIKEKEDLPSYTKHYKEILEIINNPQE